MVCEAGALRTSVWFMTGRAHVSLHIRVGGREAVINVTKETHSAKSRRDAVCTIARDCVRRCVRVYVCVFVCVGECSPVSDSSLHNPDIFHSTAPIVVSRRAGRALSSVLPLGSSTTPHHTAVSC